MEIISDIEALKAKIAACNEVLTTQGDDAMRAFFQTFKGDFSAQAPADPFSDAYRDFQIGLQEHICGRPYSPRNERTHFDLDAYAERPFPYYLKSFHTAGNYLMAVAYLLRAMDLPPGSRVLEFGPGWGETTINLALLGAEVTAVDIEPNFCALLRRRAEQHRVAIDVVEADFFWAETVTEPYDAVLFFESFHHCHDHLRLLRALRNAVKPGGQIIFGAEPIVADNDVAWGVSMAGNALWAMRNFGWLELGFDEGYFRAALRHTGWTAEKLQSADVGYATVWKARHAGLGSMRDPEPAQPAALPESPAPRIDGAAAPSIGAACTTGREHRLEQELRAIYASTSWRVTAPLRSLRRLLR